MSAIIWQPEETPGHDLCVEFWHGTGIWKRRTFSGGSPPRPDALPEDQLAARSSGDPAVLYSAPDESGS
jgi:hypothetical protein